MGLPQLRNFSAGIYNVPEVRVARRILSESEIRNLNSTPVTLVPAVANLGYIIEYCDVFREAGSAYTLNGSTFIIFTGGATDYFSFSCAALFSATTNTRIAGIEPNTLTISAGTNLNFPIVVSTNTANLTNGSGRLYVLLFYRAYTLAPPF